MTFIRVDSVSFAYDGMIPVIPDLSFEVKRGDILAIVGPSGCGKTTVLRLLAGLLQPVQGRILVGGAAPAEFRAGRGIGYVFQDYLLLPFLTVARNIAWPHDDTRREAGARIESLLRLFDLEKSRSKRPGELSGGMQARVALARALYSKPDLLLLDEATSSLDLVWRLAIADHLRTVSGELGTTTVLVSHDLEGVLGLATHLVALNSDGVISLQLGKRELFDGAYEKIVAAMRTGHPAEAYRPPGR